MAARSIKLCRALVIEVARELADRDKPPEHLAAHLSAVEENRRVLVVEVVASAERVAFRAYTTSREEGGSYTLLERTDRR